MNRSPTTFAVIAPGAMGAALAARLHSQGFPVLTSLHGRGTASAERAAQAGMRAVTEQTDLLRAEVWLSVVPPPQALPLARQFAALVSAAGYVQAPIYVDLNAINPDNARAIARIVGDAGAHCVDGCIIGLPPTADDSGPTLHLAGSAAAEVAMRLRAGGLDAHDQHAPIGAASALKMAYAGINKGLTALAACMMLAAERHGARAALLAELERSRPELLQRLRPALPDMLPKAYRWAPEMSEIADFIGSDLAESGIYRAMEAFFARLARLDADASERRLLEQRLN